MGTAGRSLSAAPDSSLRTGDTVVVIGGGPAGAFFAIHLLCEARTLDRRIDVIIVEKRQPAQPGAGGCDCRGCTFCAGVISPRLHQVFEQHRLVPPGEVIENEIDLVWIQGDWKNFPLRVAAGMRMYTVFRGSLPGRRGAPGGLDGFLLREAVKEGARLVSGDVRTIRYAASGRPEVSVTTLSQGTVSIEASFLVVAAGINTRPDCEDEADSLTTSIRRMNPAFTPGRSRKAFIFELDVGRDYLEKHMSREMYFVEYGSKHVAIEHTALVPKGRFLTVAMIGKCVDAATFPRDGERIVREFLSLPQIVRILPGVAAAPLACACFPSLAVSTARSPFGSRFAIIGDAVGARLNKDGLYSAHVTAHSLARALLHEGVDEAALSRGYGPTLKWLTADTNCGRIVFAFSRAAFGRPWLSRTVYQAFATELKIRDAWNRPLGVVLWKIASGAADYSDILKAMCGYAVWRSLLVGALVTFRNVAVERVLGLRWREHGRYPTVIIKEERDLLKQAIAASLRTGLDAAPDFERMYSIKIRGSQEQILQELGNFGEPTAGYLNLRFMKVRRIAGLQNEVGAVVRYSSLLVGALVDLRLVERVGTDILVYEAGETPIGRGKLIFHISTIDHGSRLAIYTAFGFWTGGNLAGRVFWRCVRFVFPGFVHDVVWNHALCCIKEAVERSSTTATSSEPTLSLSTRMFSGR